jgi:hypothetical protein
MKSNDDNKTGIARCWPEIPMTTVGIISECRHVLEDCVHHRVLQTQIHQGVVQHKSYFRFCLRDRGSSFVISRHVCAANPLRIRPSQQKPVVNRARSAKLVVNKARPAKLVVNKAWPSGPWTPHTCSVGTTPDPGALMLLRALQREGLELSGHSCPGHSCLPCSPAQRTLLSLGTPASPAHPCAKTL